MRFAALVCLVSILSACAPLPAAALEKDDSSTRPAWTFIRAFMEKIVNAPPEKSFFERVFDFLAEVGFFSPGKRKTSRKGHPAGVFPAGGISHA